MGPTAPLAAGSWPSGSLPKEDPVKSISRQGSRVRPARLDSRPGQGIATFIFSMAVVAAHPVPFDLVLSGQFQQALPEVPVGNRLFLGIFPTAPDPALDPLGHPFFDIFRVSGQSNAARAPECLQAGDGPDQLHAVVGGFRFIAGQLFFMATATQYGSPTPRPGVA